MLRRLSAWFLLATALASGAGCKARESAGQDSRPLPTPEPPAAPSAVLSREDAAAAPKKRAPDNELKDAASSAKRPAADATVRAPAVASATPPTAAASAAAGGAAATAVPALPSAPVFTAPSAACLSRCQGAMQGCLSAPVDGGVPGFGNLELCKKAFEACQSACK